MVLLLNQDIKITLVYAIQRKEPKGKKWTAEEDAKLLEGIAKYGEKSWKHIADMVGTRDQSQLVRNITNFLIFLTIFLPELK